MAARVDEYMKVLGVTRDASVEEIKRKARKLFFKYHPDINPGNRAACEEKTKELTEAYREILREKSREGEEGTGRGREPETQDTAEEAGEYLVFSLTERLYGFPAGSVRQVLRVKDMRIESVSIASEGLPYMAGVFYVGKEVAMLWNLYRQLRIQEPPIGSDVGRRQIVMADVDGSPVGFLVDGVRGMIRPEMTQRVLESEGERMESNYLEGITETEEGPVGLLDIKKLLYTF